MPNRTLAGWAAALLVLLSFHGKGFAFRAELPGCSLFPASGWNVPLTPVLENSILERSVPGNPLQESLPGTVRKTRAASPIRDSLFFWERTSPGTAWAGITRVSVPLMAASFLAIPVKEPVRDLRYDFYPPGKGSVAVFDNFLQYSPAALAVGLKAFGYKGRSAWGRFLVSGALSTAIMAATVNALKYSARVTRPDNSKRNSFPSGHTATAFMAATILHKEYGQTRSLWFSAGGYAAATVTGLMRIVNNRHWASDVLMGAGLGIFSTELAYWIADLIFKEKGLVRPLLPQRPRAASDKPSFASLSVGAKYVPGVYRLRDGRCLSFRPGAFAGVEGAWFLTPFWGVGGSVQLSDFNPECNGQVAEERATQYSARLGAYLSVPAHARIRFGGKVGAGYSYTGMALFSDGPAAFVKNALELSSGASFTYMASPDIGFSLFAEYVFQLFPAEAFAGASSGSGSGGRLPSSAVSGTACAHLHHVLTGGSVRLYFGRGAFLSAKKADAKKEGAKKEGAKGRARKEAGTAAAGK